MGSGGGNKFSFVIYYQEKNKIKTREFLAYSSGEAIRMSSPFFKKENIIDIRNIGKKDGLSVRMLGFKKCRHNTSKLGYVQWHEWAEKQDRNGIRQIQCPKCKKWFWPSEYGPK